MTPGGWVISENLGTLFILFFYPSISYTDILSIFIIDHLIRLLYVFIYGSSSMVAMNFNIYEIDHSNKINYKK